MALTILGRIHVTSLSSTSDAFFLVSEGRRVGTWRCLLLTDVQEEKPVSVEKYPLKITTTSSRQIMREVS